MLTSIINSGELDGRPELSLIVKRILVKLLGMLMAGLAWNLQVVGALAQGTSFTRLSITNPTPIAYENFGSSVAAVGNDRVLIGASGVDGVGAAYLFNTSGTLLATLTNPTPHRGDSFGCSGAAVGSNLMVIGASQLDTFPDAPGKAFLFNANGALLTTFTNPSSSTAAFGWSVAALGNERVVIGTYWAGAAYLFSTNGTLLTAFTNPKPSAICYFGAAVGTIGTDRVLVGAYGDDTGASDAGAVYLFNTNGGLVTTFTNPAPAASDHFGYSVTGVGNDRVLVGAPDDDTFGTGVGAAYLFTADGVLLATFLGKQGFSFSKGLGVSCMAVGVDRVLIGANANGSSPSDAGAAYLFRTNGLLLTVFTNPTPTAFEMFGSSLAMVGSDRFFIGNQSDRVGPWDRVGAAYLFTPNTPSLSIRFTASNTLAVTWPWPSAGWILQQNSGGVTPGNWATESGLIQDNGTNKTLIINQPTGDRFYRLFKP